MKNKNMRRYLKAIIIASNGNIKIDLKLKSNPRIKKINIFYFHNQLIKFILYPKIAFVKLSCIITNIYAKVPLVVKFSKIN